MNEQRVYEFVLDERWDGFVPLFSQLADHARDVDILEKKIVLKTTENSLCSLKVYLIMIERVQKQIGDECQTCPFSFIAVNHHGRV